jgi:uridine kinase
MLIRKKSIILSSLFLGLAIASDIHMVMVLPIILYLIYTKESRDETIKYMFIVLSLFLIVNFPYVLNGELVKMIRFSLQEYIGGTFLCIESFQIFNSLFVILLVYYYFFNQKQINTHLLYLYFGVLFTVPIFFKFPSPELYVYMVPYWAIYFIDHDNQKKSLFFYLFFSVVYLTFFLFFAEHDGYVIKVLDLSFDFKVLNETVRNILYTFLEVMIVIIVIAYKYSIAKNSLYRHATNLAIGIGGDSGVGKSLLLTNLTLIFRDKLLEIEGDGEHKWERGDERWNTFTHLDPKANYIHKQAEAISELKNHKVIYRSEYDHDTGKFTAPAKVKPKEIIVISGLHPFYLPKLRKIMDIKIYLDTDETLRRHWKILRDTSKRGYSKEKILKQISDREEDTQKYIYPQKKFADVIIRYFAINDFILGDDVEIQLGLKITFDASINVEGILEHLKADYTWDYNEDLKTQYIELKEQPTNNYTMLSQKSILNVDQIISSSSHWKHGYEGFIQFMLLLIISEKLKEEL